jgi:hypothetical protein
MDVLEDMHFYGLFANAVSVIESLAYAAHGLGAIRRRAAFPMMTDDARRKVGLSVTASRFVAQYPDHALTRGLIRASRSPSLEGIRIARNVLTHRATDQRSTVITPEAEWREWTLGGLARTDTVVLDWRYLDGILLMTAAHARRIGCGLDAFSGEHFNVVGAC